MAANRQKTLRDKDVWRGTDKAERDGWQERLFDRRGGLKG